MCGICVCSFWLIIINIACRGRRRMEKRKRLWKTDNVRVRDISALAQGLSFILFTPDIFQEKINYLCNAFTRVDHSRNRSYLKCSGFYLICIAIIISLTFFFFFLITSAYCILSVYISVFYKSRWYYLYFKYTHIMLTKMACSIL